MLIGLAFAWCGRDRVRADGPFAPPAFTLVLLYALVIVGPITLYLYAVHRAWSWMYWIDPASVSGLSVLPVTIGQMVAVLAAWYAGGLVLRLGKARILAIASGVVALLALVVLLFGMSRLGVYGSYADFHEGRALDLMQVKLGYVLVAMALGGGAATVYIVLELLRDSRRVRAVG